MRTSCREGFRHPVRAGAQGIRGQIAQRLHPSCSTVRLLSARLTVNTGLLTEGPRRRSIIWSLVPDLFDERRAAHAISHRRCSEVGMMSTFPRSASVQYCRSLGLTGSHDQSGHPAREVLKNFREISQGRVFLQECLQVFEKLNRIDFLRKKTFGGAFRKSFNSLAPEATVP